jgi:ribosomal-protein-alanine N-acetyltransferase
VDSQWPVVLSHGDIRLRPLKRSDKSAWHELRRHNADWLREWDATLPVADGSVPRTYSAMVRNLRREGRAGRTLSFGVEHHGILVGQVTLAGIAWGSLRSAHIGYWIDERTAGRGIIPTAVAMTCDFAFDQLHLHRLEINVRTENAASRRVAAKLGFRTEGLRESYLHINGEWRDHMCFVLREGDQPQGVLSRWESQKSQP